MKVIGETKEGFLVEAKKHELRDITGESRLEPCIGNVIDIHESWSRLRDLVNCRERFDEIQKKLRSISDAIAPMVSVVDRKDGN